MCQHSVDQESIDILLIAGNRLDTPRLPVGLGFVAQAIEDAGFTYKMCDVVLQSEQYILGRVRKYRPRFIGISTMTLKAYQNYNLIRELKKISDAVIILGGPHVIADKEHIFNDCPEIDIAIQGEGEVAVVEILKGTTWDKVPQAVFRNKDGSLHVNPIEYLDINAVSFPRYHGFPLERYESNMSLASSRGCVQNCIFCGARRFLGRQWRARTSAGMFEEFTYWYQRGYKNFYFSDSLFSKDKERIFQFCDKVKESGIKDVSFTADGIRADHISFKLLRSMKDIGFYNITIGVESVSNNVLKFFAKGETFEQIDAAIQMADALDFDIGCFFILGSPDETKEEIEASLAYPLKYSNITMTHYHKLTPVPGTPYFDYALAHGLTSVNLRYGTDNEYWTHAEIGTKHVSASQLQEYLQRGEEIEVFLNKRRVVRNLLRQKTGKTPPADVLNRYTCEIVKAEENAKSAHGAACQQ